MALAPEPSWTCEWVHFSFLCYLIITESFFIVFQTFHKHPVLVVRSEIIYILLLIISGFVTSVKKQKTKECHKTTLVAQVSILQCTTDVFTRSHCIHIVCDVVHYGREKNSESLRNTLDLMWKKHGEAEFGDKDNPDCALLIHQTASEHQLWLSCSFNCRG